MPGYIVLMIVLTLVLPRLGEKKKLIGIFLAIGIIFSISYITNWWNESNDNPFDYARITEVDYKAVVVDEKFSNGKVIITQRLTFDIHAASEDNLFWELWRDLPEEYIDGVKVDYEVNYVKQILDDKTEVMYKKSPELYWDDNDYINTAGGYGPGKWYHSKGPYDGEYNFECVLFYVDGLYRETVVFEIEYEMYNASLRYLDSSELYLSLYSGSSIKYLKSFKGQILFPNEKMPTSGNYEAYTYGTNSNAFALKESTTTNPGYNTFSFELDESQLKFKPYNEYIEFALISHGADKHKFTEYASINNYYNTDMLSKINEQQAKYEALPEKWKTNKLITLLLCSAGTFIIVGYAFLLNKKIKKKYTFYQPTMEMDYFRDIPSNLDPNFAATLVFCKDNKSSDDIEDGYAAVMLSLVRKGYVELERIRPEKDWDNSNIKIIVKYKPIEQQRPKKPCPKCGKQSALEAIRCIFCGTTFTNGNNTDIEAPVFSNSPAASTITPLNPFKIVQPQNQESGQIPNQEQVTSNVKPLTPTEEQYFNLILRHSHGVEITLNSFQEKISSDYQYTTSFVKNIKNAITNIGVSEGYFQNDKYKEPKEKVKGWSFTLGIIGFLLLTVGNYASYQTRLDFAFGSFFILGIGFIVGAIYLGKVAKKYILLTQYGEDEYAKWRGLYNFLNSETLMNERTVIEIVIWEQYLVYATAFGISKKVIKALEVRCPNVEISPVLCNPYYRSIHFHTHSRSFRTAARSASYTSRSGGHGGYGGGGRGGGGGGGGH